MARFIGTRHTSRLSRRLVALIYSPPSREAPYIDETIVAWDGTRYEVDTRSDCEWDVFVKGGYEISLQRLMASLVTPGDVVVDCGANVGIHTCFLARRVGPAGRVISVEPIQALSQRLRRNVELNALDNIDVVVKATSSAPGRALMYPPIPGTSNQGLGSLYYRSGVSSRGVPTELDTLDNIVAAVKADRVNLIKIDVEGSELETLLGCARILSSFRPPVVFEYSPVTYGAADISWLQLTEWLCQRNGYTLFELVEDELRPVAPAALRQAPWRWNVMLLARPPRATEGLAG